MTHRSGERRDRMVALLEEALDSGALVFSEPLLDALDAAPADEFYGHVRTEHGIAYTIERKLGRGGMATVYLARDSKHDRPIAIKVLHADLVARVGAQRFVREIRLTARLQHPHVLGLLDSGVFERSDREAGVLAGRPYYIMPYVEGESLRARLARDGALPLPDAMRVLRDVADALCYAHDQGVIHRDIKPENILLSRGHALVADFGIAKALNAAQQSERPDGANAKDRFDGESSNEPSPGPPIALTHASTLLGTPGYMAPEQTAAEARVDHRADLYAWGVVAYEILTGQNPFGATRSSANSRSAQMTEVPRSIREVVPRVPVALAALVMRCLSNAPTDRPSSAADVVVALDSVAIGTRAERPSPPATQHPVRRRVMAALVLSPVLFAATDYARVRPRTMVVVGIGNPATDIAAVQYAVDRADTVVLTGTLSFHSPPTKLVDPILASAKNPTPGKTQVLVSKAVTILGLPDTSGRMTTIDGGTIPFYVDAVESRVTIRGLRFVRPIAAAILVNAARGLEIASNSIEGVKPFGGVRGAIIINTSGGIPIPTDSGRPNRVSGTLTIRQNKIDVTDGTERGMGVGILVWSVGESHSGEVVLDIIGNSIRNTTSSAIMVRRAVGAVHVVSNSVETSADVPPREPDHEAVRLVNTGSYQMGHNSILCRWANCVGIAVFSQASEWPIRGATIEDNEVNIVPPLGTALADSSAAIRIKGFADSNVVRLNTIRGRARAALVLETFKFGYPRYNSFIDNRVDDFHASVASVIVGSGVLGTRLVRPGKVVDRGEKTVIEQ
jgi:serine/threonine protein kinase